MEGPGLPGLSLNKSSRNSIGGDTDGMANDCLNRPRHRLHKYQINTYNACIRQKKNKKKKKQITMVNTQLNFRSKAVLSRFIFESARFRCGEERGG